MRSPVRIRVAAPDNPEGKPSGLWFFIGSCKTFVGVFSLWGCPELLPYTSERALCRRSRFGPHTRSEVPQACLQGEARGYLRRGRIPGAAPDILAAARSPSGKNSYQLFLIPSGRYATPKGNLRGFGFLYGFCVTFAAVPIYMSGLSGADTRRRYR